MSGCQAHGKDAKLSSQPPTAAAPSLPPPPSSSLLPVKVVVGGDGLGLDSWLWTYMRRNMTSFTTIAQDRRRTRGPFSVCQPSIDQSTLPSSANATRLLARVAEDGGAIFEASIDPIGVEIGAALDAHGDQTVNTLY